MSLDMALLLESLPALQKLVIVASDALSIDVREPFIGGSRLQDLQLVGNRVEMRKLIVLETTLQGLRGLWQVALRK